MYICRSQLSQANVSKKRGHDGEEKGEQHEQQLQLRSICHDWTDLPAAHDPRNERYSGSMRMDKLGDLWGQSGYRHHLTSPTFQQETIITEDNLFQNFTIRKLEGRNFAARKFRHFFTSS